MVAAGQGKLRSCKGRGTRNLVATCTAVAGLLLVVPAPRLAYVAARGGELLLQKRQELREALVKQQAEQLLQMREQFLRARDGVQANELDSLLGAVKEACADAGVSGEDFSMDELLEALRLYRGTKTQAATAQRAEHASEDLQEEMHLIAFMREMENTGWKESVNDPAFLASQKAYTQKRLDKLQVAKVQADASKTMRMKSVYEEALQRMGTDSPGSYAKQAVASAFQGLPPAAEFQAVASVPPAVQPGDSEKVRRIKELLANPGLPAASRKQMEAFLAAA